MWKSSTDKRNYSPYGTGAKGVDLDTQICTLQFTTLDDIKPPVLFYYRLTNFYQNHRRYVKSLDSDQLKGVAVSKNTIKGGACDPLRLNGTTDLPYYPCGLIANSLFNDTFHSPRRVGDSNDGIVYNMTDKGIAWSSDAGRYFPTKYNNSEIVPPPNWRRRYPDGYTDDTPPPNLHVWEEFQVWMRTAGLPTFSKLAMRNDNEVMKQGTYEVEIEMSTLLSLA